MFRGLSKLLSAVAVFSLAGLALTDEPRESKVPLSDLPDAVRKVAHESVKTAGFKRVDCSEAMCLEASGRKTFDIDGKDAECREVEVEVCEDGTVVELEREIPESEVPGELRKTLKSNMQDFECEKFEAIDDGGEVFGYDFGGTRPDKEYEGSGKLRITEGEDEDHERDRAGDKPGSSR